MARSPLFILTLQMLCSPLTVELLLNAFVVALLYTVIPSFPNLAHLLVNPKKEVDLLSSNLSCEALC